MSDRTLSWLGAGLVLTGMSAAMLLGAGVATAAPDTGSQAESDTRTTRTETADEDDKPSDPEDADEGPEDADDDSEDADENADDAPADVADEPHNHDADADVTEEPGEEPDTEVDEDVPEKPGEEPVAEDHVVDLAAEELEVEPTSLTDPAPRSGGHGRDDNPPVTVDTVVRTEPDSPAAEVDPEEPTIVDAKLRPAVANTQSAQASHPEVIAPQDAAEEAERNLRDIELTMQIDEVAAEPRTTPTLINVLGSVVFGVLDFFVKIVAGPATVPRGSTVQVGRSALEIDCGDGYTTEADWYVPTGAQAPAGLIVLQHGFAAHAGFYNKTAAELAEQTNSIVLAPTITSNIFACDSCHLTGDPMHFAVAKLFSGDREALNASLGAAFPDEDIALPQKYVLAGHSGGSQLAAGTAGFASQLAGPGGSPDLAGVLLFETNDIGDIVSRGIAKVPLTTPVYYLGGDPAILNKFDDLSPILQQLRPNQFTGFRLAGGTHFDIMSSTNPLPRFAASLLLGFPEPHNTAAAELLAAGWITDMFSASDDVGIYADPETAVDIVTESGTAHVVSIGGPPYEPNGFESLIGYFFELGNNLRFGFCAADVDALLEAELGTSLSEPRRQRDCGSLST